MKKPKPPLLQKALDSDAHNALLGDLESIRAVLTLDDDPLPVEEDNVDVPVLEDMVDGAFTVDESTLTSRASFDDEAVVSGGSRLADETIEALLGDQWRTEADRILAAARARVEGTGGEASTAQLQDFNASLRTRIDSILDNWLTEMMHARIDDLRARLMEVLELELNEFIRALTDEEQHFTDKDQYGK